MCTEPLLLVTFVADKKSWRVGSSSSLLLYGWHGKDAWLAGFEASLSDREMEGTIRQVFLHVNLFSCYCSIKMLRRECLDHIIVFNESSLRHILKAYFEYYEHSRTHLALEKDAPESRAIQTREAGIVVELPQMGGLHHRYERRAA